MAGGAVSWVMRAMILSVLAIVPGLAGVVGVAGLGARAGGAMAPPDEFGAPPRAQDLVQVRLMPAVAAPTTPTTSTSPTSDPKPAVAAETSVKVVLPVVFTVAPEWHTYWPGQNATGTPIAWTVSMGPGVDQRPGAKVTVGTPVYPAPTRYLGGGDLLDYALTGTFTVMLPLTVTHAAKGGTGEGASKATLPLRVKIEYLVCKDSCIPGEVELATEVSLVLAPAGDAGQRVEAAGGGAASPHLRVEPLPAGLLKAAWSDETPEARLALVSTPPVAMEFYPLEDGPELIDSVATGASASGNMLLRFRHAAKAVTATNLTAPGKPTIRGVVRLGSGASAKAYDLTLPWGEQPVTTP